MALIIIPINVFVGNLVRLSTGGSQYLFQFMELYESLIEHLANLNIHSFSIIGGQ